MEISKIGKSLLTNSGYMSVLEVFTLLTPLIIYPYLIRVLGVEVYSLIIVGQAAASFPILLTNFGFRRIAPVMVAESRANKESLSRIVCSIFFSRLLLLCLGFIPYSLIILFTDIFQSNKFYFLVFYGFVLNELLFPQFYFQGIEKMKLITFIQTGINLLYIALIFSFIRNESDYYLFPFLKITGYAIGGVASSLILFYRHKLTFYITPFSQIITLIKKAASIFFTELISLVKDKSNIFLIGTYLGKTELAYYDLGLKLVQLLARPSKIIGKVFLPQIAINKSVKLYKKGMIIVFIFTAIPLILSITFLNPITKYLLDQNINLTFLRYFLISSLFLSISSYIATGNHIAFGKPQYLLRSIIVTSSFFVSSIILGFLTGWYTSLEYYIIITILTYFVELIYRYYLSTKILI